MLDFLEEAGNTDLHEFVEIVGSNGEKLYAFEKRITWVAGFFEYTAIEFEPLNVAIEVVARIFETNSGHMLSSLGRGRKEISVVCYRDMNEPYDGKLRRTETR